MFGQLLLGVTGAIFFGLGVVSVYDPEIPAAWSGIFIASQDAYAEIAAMYGGLEIAIGSILLASALMKEYLKAGLWLLFIIISYIGAARPLHLQCQEQVLGLGLGVVPGPAQAPVLRTVFRPVLPL